MADRAHIFADKEIAKVERKLTSTYKRTIKSIRGRWFDYLSEVQKDIADKEKAYKLLLNSGAKADDLQRAAIQLQKAKQERILMNKKYENLVEETTTKLANVNREALEIIQKRTPAVYSANRNFIGESVKGVIDGYNFTVVNEATVGRLARTGEMLLPPRKVLDIPKDKLWNAKKINAEILQGILTGEPIPDIAKRLVKIIGMNWESAKRNARTIITESENKGRLDGMREAERLGIVLQKRWLATLDGRTRHDHAMANGQTVAIDAPFDVGGYEMEYPADPKAPAFLVYNCRCTMVAEVKGFVKR